MLVLFTDTDTDMSLELANQMGWNLICMPYTINDKIYTSDLIAETSVEKSYMFIVVDIGIVLAILVIIKFAFTPKKRKKVKKSKKSSKNYRNKSGLL